VRWGTLVVYHSVAVPTVAIQANVNCPHQPLGRVLSGLTSARALIRPVPRSEPLDRRHFGKYLHGAKNERASTGVLTTLSSFMFRTCTGKPARPVRLLAATRPAASPTPSGDLRRHLRERRPGRISEILVARPELELAHIVWELGLDPADPGIGARAAEGIGATVEWTIHGRCRWCELGGDQVVRWRDRSLAACIQ
jgi:hypothetical protein